VICDLSLGQLVSNKDQLTYMVIQLRHTPDSILTVGTRWITLLKTDVPQNRMSDVLAGEMFEISAATVRSATAPK